MKKLKYNSAVKKVIKAVMIFSRKKRNWEYNRARYAISYALNVKYMANGYQNEGAQTIKAFLSDTGTCWNMKQKFERFNTILNNVQKQFRTTINAHKAQLERVRELFESERKNLMNQLLTNKKFKRVPGQGEVMDKFYSNIDELKTVMSNM